MKIDIEQGLLEAVRFVASPNHDARPDSGDISLIVIHNISLPPNEFGGPGIEQLFTNSLAPKAHPYYAEIHALRVSSHLLIRRDGAVVQYVPFHRRAWHAGASRYAGRERCNDFSIGIELEGADEVPYAEAQYAMLEELIEVLCRSYDGLSRQRIVGHSDISPQRKTDPGAAFNWAKISLT